MTGDGQGIAPSRVEFFNWLSSSCERQGIAITVSDSATIEYVSALFGVTSSRTRVRQDKQEDRQLSEQAA